MNIIGWTPTMYSSCSSMGKMNTSPNTMNTFDQQQHEWTSTTWGALVTKWWSSTTWRTPSKTWWTPKTMYLGYNLASHMGKAMPPTYTLNLNVTSTLNLNHVSTLNLKLLLSLNSPHLDI
jgi:hypothetical protein